MTPSQPTVLTRGGGECHHQSDITVLLHQSNKDNRHRRHGTEAHREEGKKNRKNFACVRQMTRCVCVCHQHFQCCWVLSKYHMVCWFLCKLGFNSSSAITTVLLLLGWFWFAVLVVLLACLLTEQFEWTSIWLCDLLACCHAPIETVLYCEFFFCILFGKQIKSYFLILDQNLKLWTAFFLSVEQGYFLLWSL